VFRLVGFFGLSAGLRFIASQGVMMKNFDNLFAAWMFVWAVFFLYEVSIARRMARLRRELDDLRQQLRNKQ
jgi:CcmD family protein